VRRVFRYRIRDKSIFEYYEDHGQNRMIELEYGGMKFDRE
jgi:hypothetical protein